MTRHVLWVEVSAAMFFALLRPLAGQPSSGPTFRFEVGGFPAPPTAEAGVPFRQELLCFVTTESNPDPVRGAEAYSLSLAADGVSITGITVARTASADVHDDAPGLRNDGFERSELTSGGTGGCDGFSGSVSTVILSNTLPITLPSESTEIVARLTVEGVYPAKGETRHASIRYVDGCKGEGEPTLNRVRYAGSWVAPVTVDQLIDLKAWPDCPSPAAPLQVIFQTRSTEQTSELFQGIAPTPDPSAPAEIFVPPGRTTVYAAIVSQLPPDGPGLQGWAFSVSLTGDATLVDATTHNTAAAPTTDSPPGLFKDGLGTTRVVDPKAGLGGPQGQGAVSAIVLSLTEIVTLKPIGTATLLALTIDGEEGQSGQLVWKDGLMGSGGPVSNVAVLQGASRYFDCFQKANIHFKTPVNPFHRGDVNNDGRMDISDPIRLLNYLFLGAKEPSCLDAADFNDDAKLDMSDAVNILLLKFNGGSQPPPPGGPANPCGLDPEPHVPGGCAEYTHC